MRELENRSSLLSLTAGQQKKSPAINDGPKPGKKNTALIE